MGGILNLNFNLNFEGQWQGNHERIDRDTYSSLTITQFHYRPYFADVGFGTLIKKDRLFPPEFLTLRLCLSTPVTSSKTL